MKYTPINDNFYRDLTSMDKVHARVWHEAARVSPIPNMLVLSANLDAPQYIPAGSMLGTESLPYLDGAYPSIISREGRTV